MEPRGGTVKAVNNKGADQTAQVRTLIRTFVFHIDLKVGFLRTGLIYFIDKLSLNQYDILFSFEKVCGFCEESMKQMS